MNLANDDKDKEGKSNSRIPKELTRRYELVIIPGPGSKNKTIPLRQLRAEQIGSLQTIKGIVVKMTDVKPFLKVASYSCDVCGYEIYQVINQRTYMPLISCESEQCRNNHSQGDIMQINRASKFLSFQEITIQEPTNEVPTGHVPRSIKISCFGSTTRKCAPGDMIIVTGVYLPRMLDDARLKSKMIHDTYIEAFKIEKEKKNYQETKINSETINMLKKDKSLYINLAKSIAPEIFGMEDIKKALLLLLVGGVDKTLPDGMKIRGNLNILLMGDPGIAKSQLLKYISHLSPRGVYTTGKGSSGVGLTAAVVKDPVTNDLVLEGGALVLADMGVCCIDEFDKMSDYDRANIHEVMEQQTVSIAKAGITTRLNARTSVLAAANPVYGRYNTSLTPHENINLPAALLSRFDLLFLLLDEVNPERDLELARHVAYVHQHKKVNSDNKDNKIYNEEFIREYIAQAKKCKPTIPQDLHNFIVQKYVEKRKLEIEQKNKQGYQYITPRSLLAVIRLSQALAKLRMNDKVKQEDVDEALRLVDVSQSSINKKENKEGLATFDGVGKKMDAKSQIYNIVSELCKSDKNKTVKIDVIKKKIRLRNFTDKQLENMLQEYVNLSILYVDENHTEVTLL
jgi:DNA replication licensing factor MCM7